jgi:hypothetical protein
METDPDQMPDPVDDNPEEGTQGDPPPDEGSGGSSPMPEAPGTGA